MTIDYLKKPVRIIMASFYCLSGSFGACSVVGAGTRNRPPVLGWHMRRYFSYCIASDLTDPKLEKVWPSILNEFTKTQKNQRPHNEQF